MPVLSLHNTHTLPPSGSASYTLGLSGNAYPDLNRQIENAYPDLNRQIAPGLTGTYTFSTQVGNVLGTYYIFCHHFIK